MSKRYQFLLLACVFTLAIALAGTATAQTVIINEDFSGLPDGPATDPFTANHTWMNVSGFGAGDNAAINGETFEKVGDEVFIRWVSDITPVDLSAVTNLLVEWDWIPTNSPQPGGGNNENHLWAMELVDSTNRGQEFFRFRVESTVADVFMRVDSDQFPNVHQLIDNGLTEVAEPDNIIKASDTYRVSANVTQTDITMTITDITAGLPGTLIETQTASFAGGLVKVGPEVFNQVEMSVLQGALARCDNIFIGIDGASPIPPEPTPTPIPPLGVEEWRLFK